MLFVGSLGMKNLISLKDACEDAEVQVSSGEIVVRQDVASGDAMSKYIQLKTSRAN